MCDGWLAGERGWQKLKTSMSTPQHGIAMKHMIVRASSRAYEARNTSMLAGTSRPPSPSGRPPSRPTQFKRIKAM